MYEMFPVSGIKYSPVRYSNNLNKLIIQDNLLRHNYFSKDIPMWVLNFYLDYQFLLNNSYFY